MENPYKEPLKKCILCGKRVDYKNVQVRSGFTSLYFRVFLLLDLLKENQVSL